MKRFLYILLKLGLCSSFVLAQDQSKSPTVIEVELWTAPTVIEIPHENVWLPITEQEIQNELIRNVNDGVQLNSLQFRAHLYGKDLELLRSLKAMMKVQPNNAFLKAAFVRAALPFRSGWIGRERVKSSITAQIEGVDLRVLLETAKATDPKCWLTYVAESQWIPGSGYGNLNTMRTDAMNAAMRAYELEA